jgi:AcrR family transcriptional regulator
VVSKLPKPMFFNISKDKQVHFIQKASLEFTQKQFEDISILSLSKRIGISRGTFYNYFDSVGELFEYLFQQVKEKRHLYAFDIYKEFNHNIFVFIKKLFEYDFDQFMEEKKYSFLKNYIHYLHISHKSFKDHFILPVLLPLMENAGDDISSLNIYHVSNKEFFLSLELLGNNISRLLVEAESKQLDKLQIFEDFDFIIHLIETGLKHIKGDQL